MAKIVVTIDTNEKNDDKEAVIHASINGKEIENMHEVRLHKFGEFLSIELVAREVMDDELFVKRTEFSAFAKEILEEAGIKIVMQEAKATGNLEDILEKMGKKHWTRS